MSVKVIDTLKPKNNGVFPVAEAVDIAVTSDLRLTAALDAKANASDLSSTNAIVETKADKETTTSLQNQINAIVSPVTQDAEVENARVGADGTAYQTLKARIDAENEQMNANLVEFEDADGSKISLVFEQGSLSSSNGTETENSKRIRNTGYIKYLRYFKIDSQHYVWLFQYDKNKTFISASLSNVREHKFSDFNENAVYFRVVVTKNNQNADIAPSEVLDYTCLYDRTKDVAENISRSPYEYEHEATLYQGTVSGNIRKSTSYRIRTDFLPTKNVVRFKHNAPYYLINYYDADFKTIVNGTFKTPKTVVIDTTYPYFAVILANKTDYSETISPQGVYCKLDYTFDATQTAAKDISDLNSAYDSKLPAKMKNIGEAKDIINIIPTSAACFVGDLFVTFTPSSDDLSTEPGVVTVYQKIEGSYTAINEFYHFFGHCNTVDYNPDNDCLILGNGSGSYNLDGKIFIIPNWSDVLQIETANAISLTYVDALIIDCAEYNFGTKFNVLWGENNKNNGKFVYLITARKGATTTAPDAGDNGTIRKLILGTGENEYEYGTASENATPYNGTFAVVGTYTQIATNYDDCNQDTTFYKGALWSSIGHGGCRVWKMECIDGDIITQPYGNKYYNENGTEAEIYMTGAAVHGDLVYFGIGNNYYGFDLR